MSNRDQNEAGEMELNAFRFLAGEMSSDEQSRFEERLANEPQLAGVLSQVIELDDVLEQELAGVRSEESARPVVRVAEAHEAAAGKQTMFPVVVAVAACLLVAVLVAPRAMQPKAESVATNEVVEPPAEFVDQWLEAIAVDTSEFIDLPEPDDEPIELAMLDQTDVASDTDDIVPGWMYVAFEEDTANGATVE